MGPLTGKKVSTFYKVRPTANVKGKGKGKASSDADIKGHTDEVLSLALTGGGKLLESLGKDGRLGVWIRRKLSGLKSFLDIRDITLSVCSSFFSACSTYTNGCFLRILLFGKEPTNFTPAPLVLRSKYTILPRPLWVTWKHSLGTKITHLALDGLRGETCVTVGGCDKTWKIVREWWSHSGERNFSGWSER